MLLRARLRPRGREAGAEDEAELPGEERYFSWSHDCDRDNRSNASLASFEDLAGLEVQEEENEKKNRSVPFDFFTEVFIECLEVRVSEESDRHQVRAS